MMQFWQTTIFSRLMEIVFTELVSIFLTLLIVDFLLNRAFHRRDRERWKRTERLVIVRMVETLERFQDTLLDFLEGYRPKLSKEYGVEPNKILDHLINNYDDLIKSRLQQWQPSDWMMLSELTKEVGAELKDLVLFVQGPDAHILDDLMDIEFSINAFVDTIQQMQYLDNMRNYRGASVQIQFVENAAINELYSLLQTIKKKAPLLE